MPATLTVNTTADVVNPTDGTLSLRDAISAIDAGNANGLTASEQNQVSGTFGVNDTIQFDSGLSGKTITLSGSSLPTITQNMTINGLGASNLAINGNNQSGIFSINNGAQIGIAGLTIEDGNTSGDGGAIDNAGTLTVSNATLSDNSASFGGGIANDDGMVTVTNATFSNNSSSGDGGGIWSNYLSNPLSINGSTFTGNSAGGSGGGIFGEGSITNSSFSENTAGDNGGAIQNDDGGTMTVSGTMLENNSANGGGGISTGPSTYTTLLISNCTISGNSAEGSVGSGGGIENFGGQLTVSNSTISDNAAGSVGGGGIWSEFGSTTVLNCILSGNSSPENSGGAILNLLDNSLTVSNSIIEGNSGLYGSGIANILGTASVSNSTLSGNSTSNVGAGIFNQGTMTVIDSTLANNSGIGAAAIWSDDELSVTDSTIADNSDSGSGAIGNYYGGTAILNNTIVANNSGGDLNLDTGYGSTYSGSYDLIGDGSYLSSFSNSLSGNPLLAPLGNYGGPLVGAPGNQQVLQTMALLPGSAAIDAGSNALAVDANGNPLITDERGQPRIVNGTVDIGAFESQGFILTASSGNNQTAFINTNFPNALTVTVTPNNPLEPVNGGVITFAAPNTGASAILSANTVTISGGTASVTATANGTPGSYAVTASTTGAGTPAFFDLTNEENLILVLDPTDSGALSLSGNADISLQGGNVVVDSNAKHALTDSGNANITAGSIQVAGGVSISGNATISPAPLTGQTPMTDPLAYLTAPSTSGLTNYGSVSYSNGTHTLNPGIYTSIKASGSASLTLNPGVYVIEGGGVAVSGDATIAGSGATIYNTSSGTGSYGAITLSGNGTVALAAPTSGPYDGVVIFQDRANTKAITFSGNASEGMGGAIYAPAATMYVTGGASVNGPVVVNELSVSGDATLTQTLLVSGANKLDPGPTMTVPSSKGVPISGGSAAVADHLFNDPTFLPNNATGADSSGIASLAAMLQQDVASAAKCLDSLLSSKAGAMGVTRDTLMRNAPQSAFKN